MMPGTPQAILGNLAAPTPPQRRPMFELNPNSPGDDDDEDDSDEERIPRPMIKVQPIRPQLPAVPDRSGPPTISLSILLDFAVQQIFHEVTVLAELLPKKQDSDKKVTLVQFAHSTRLLFVKLLAVVRWLKTSKKFDACTSICHLLDQQSQYFVDTADKLAILARDELILARLPTFQVAAAVDVLTLGTFPRLPLCIKNRFIRDQKITPREQAYALQRINQVLNFRIACVANKLSPRIDSIKVRNGMAVFTVPGEFEATVTVLGEQEKLKWSLLNIKMLVEDYEIGYGMQLVHPLQMNMIHEVLQQRMDEAVQPLCEMYSFIHSFAQMLQLDVLHCQASQLVTGRLREKMSIEKYDQKERVLTIGYWLQLEKGKRAVGQSTKFTPSYRLQIYGDNDAPLKLRHLPAGPDLMEVDTRSGRLSMIELLSLALDARCNNRLLRIRKRLVGAESKALIEMTGMAAPSLRYVLLADATIPAPNPTEDETLRLTVNMFSGKVLCQLPALGDRSELRDLEAALYSGSTTSEKISALIYRLKVLLLIERYRKAISVLQVRVMSEAQMKSLFDKLEPLSHDRLCVQFIKEESFYLIISFIRDPTLVVATRLHLLETPSMTLTELVDGDINLPPSMAVYMKVDGSKKYVPPSRRNYFSSWERPLTCAIAAVDDRIAFSRVCNELEKKGFRFSPIQTEPIVGGLILHITDVSEAIPEQCKAFFNSLRRCCLRLDSKNRLVWPFECCLVDAPLVSDFIPHKKGNRISSNIIDLVSVPSGQSVPENIASSISERLSTFCHIYDLVARFAAVYYKHYKEYCSVLHFTYHKLVLAYGERRDKIVAVNYKPKPAAINVSKLTINFGQCAPVDFHLREGNDLPVTGIAEDVQWNPHAIMSSILTERINEEWDLVELVHYLVHSIVPLQALSNFFRFRFESQKVTAQMLNVEFFFPLWFKCHLIAVNETTVRLVYSHIHLEFIMSEDSMIFVRDVSMKQPAAAGLIRLYHILAGSTGSAQFMESESVGGSVLNDNPPSAMMEPITPASLSHDPHDVSSPIGSMGSSGPRSCAARIDMMDRQAMGSPSFSSRLSKSVGASSSGSPIVPSNAAPGTSATNNGDDSIRPCTRTPELILTDRLIMVDHATHTKACTFVDTGNGIVGDLRASPLDDYLHALVFLKRLGHSLETYRQTAPPPHFTTFIDLQSNVEQVRCMVHAASAGRSSPPAIIYFNFHLNPNTMRLKLKMEYVGESPGEWEIGVAERYFETCVARLNNELAVMSFINICRCTAYNAFADFAKVMQAQMEPSPHTYYAVSLVLSGVNSAKKFASTAVIDPQSLAVQFTFCFRVNQRRKLLSEKHQIRMIYNMLQNSVKIPQTAQPVAIDGEDTAKMISQISDSSNRQGLCPVWPIVQHLLDKYGQANVAAMPSSVMPGSVGMPMSVGGSVGPGSIAAPGSNASMR